MTDHKKTSLLDARNKIDAIDTEIHSLLMQRAELVQNIQSAKQALGPIVNAMHADREIAMFERFNKNHKGILPIASLQRMFREMIATFSHLQCPFRVFILQGEPIYRDVARYFYGTVIEVIECENLNILLSKIKKPTSDIILLPSDATALDAFAQMIDDDWALNFDLKPHIFARLPFWEDGVAFGLELPDMLVLGHAPMKRTGDDISVLSLAGSLSQTQPLVEQAKLDIVEVFEGADVSYYMARTFALEADDGYKKLEQLCILDQIQMDCIGIYGKVKIKNNGMK